MSEKNTVEVVIDGKIYQLSGAENESYMHEVASYLNQKIMTFKRELPNYNKLEDNLKALLLEINVCDDLFKEREKTREAERDKDDQEREAYSAKHDLVNMQMKLEAALKELADTQKQLEELEQREKARMNLLKEEHGAENKTLSDRIMNNGTASASKVSTTLQKMLKEN